MGVAADIAAKDGEAIALPGDMANEADIVRLFDETERVFGPITHLVNSAGIGRPDAASRTTTRRRSTDLFAVNVIGLMLCCREAARRMSTKNGGKGGAIVNVSSMAATLGRPRRARRPMPRARARSTPSPRASPARSRPRASG